MPQDNYNKTYDAKAYREIKGGFDDTISEATRLRRAEAESAAQEEEYASKPFQMMRDYFKNLFQKMTAIWIRGNLL